MAPRISYRTSVTSLAFVLGLGAAVTGCTASQVSSDGAKIAVLYDEPIGCENLGVVIGRGGGMTGAYSKPSVNQQSAENNAINEAAKLGATHLLIHPEEVEQGNDADPDYQDPTPTMEMAHGSGTGSTVSVAATAYRCALATPATKSSMSIRSGSAFVEVKAPTAIAFAPLGVLKRVVVYRRVPLPSGTGMGEDEVFVIDEQERILEVTGSLEQVVEDPMKYIPTHRVEFVGELGTQSLLYGFGYLQYAGKVYRLTDGKFEEILNLREDVKGPEVETDTPLEETTSGGEAP